MAHLQLESVVKSYGQTQVLHGVDLTVPSGAFCVFVGPSGCGKSTLLRMIAGLEPITGGKVMIDGAVVNDLAPHRREVAMVFQNYALYPHMSVYDNMAFGLKMARMPKGEIDRRVRRAAASLRIDPLLERRPAALSGGQRQRVAIGRAITRDPKIFLFDEPLSNLDAELRVSMRLEIARLHKELGATMVYVTHDQVEAMTLADLIVVMNAGRIEQIGTPEDIYERPANRFVAGFMGAPRMNFLPGRVETKEGGPVVALGGGRTLPLAGAAIGALAPGQAVSLGIRPEALRIAGAGEPGAVPLGVFHSEYLGGSNYIYLDAGELIPQADEHLVVAAPTSQRPSVGDKVGIVFDAARLHVFDEEGNAIGA